MLTKGLDLIATATSANSSLTLISGESGRSAFFLNHTDLTDKANATAYTDALNSANQKFVQVKGPGGLAKSHLGVTIGASASASSNSMSASNSEMQSR